MCGILYSALGKYDAPPTREGRANAVAALKRVARRAADGGVTLGLEVVNRYETNLLNTAVRPFVCASIPSLESANLGFNRPLTLHPSGEGD